MVPKKREIITLIICLILLLFISLGIFYIYKVEINDGDFSQKQIELTEDILPIPNRIIYKNSNNEYSIWDQNSGDVFSIIYSEMYNQMQKKIEGIVYAEDGISGLQERGRFIEFDYNTKSKNYVFFLDEDDVGIIKRFSDGGQVIKTHLDNKGKLIKKLDSYAKRYEKYSFESMNFISKNQLKDFYSIYDITQKREGVFQTVLTYDEEENLNLLEILDAIKFESDNKLPTIDFDKQNVIITISKYDFDKIRVNIGNVKYEFGKENEYYTVDVLVLSKVTNENCIYYNLYNSGDYTELNKYVNITTSGVIQEINENSIKIGLGDYKEEYVVNINSNTTIMNYETSERVDISNLNQWDIVYVEGEKSLEVDGVTEINANRIEICSREKVKKEVSAWLIDTYRIDGPGIEYSSVDNSGNGFIVVGWYYDKFKYPIKLNVNSKTETFLGMGRHLQSNYGYVLHEICDITLDTKITDVDNIKGYVTTIEYIAD